MDNGPTDYYPVFLVLKGRPCLVIGGGKVAERKVTGLLAAGGQVTVISPGCTEGLRARQASGLIRWLKRRYQPGDLAGVFLAIAATDETQVNEAVAHEAEERGIPLNVVDATPLCSFITPSVVRRGAVTLAIATGGASPALAKRIRIALEESGALDYAEMADMVAEVRAELQARGTTVDPGAWQEGLNQEVLRLHQSGRRDESRALLLGHLEEWAHEAMVRTS